MNSEDAVILEEIRNGNTQKYGIIVERYQKQVLACAWAILQNYTDSADVAQEVFIRFFRCMDQFDSRRPLKPYLLAMSANCAKNLIRKKKRLKEVSDVIPERSDFVSSRERSPVNELLHNEKLQRIRSFIHDLPETLREVCSLFYLSECSCNEVSGILKISEGAVKVALHRARKRLLERGIREWNVE